MKPEVKDVSLNICQLINSPMLRWCPKFKLYFFYFSKAQHCTLQIFKLLQAVSNQRTPQIADAKIVSQMQAVIFLLFESLHYSTATSHNFKMGFQFAFNHLGKMSAYEPKWPITPELIPVSVA